MKVVLLSYTGTEKETGRVFEKVDESNPLPIVIGKGDVLAKIEENVKSMKIGEEREIEVTPSEGFGERKSNLIVLISEREFKKRGITPVPGLVVNADGARGKIISVSGGRVQVDFNHPLAGKTLIYRIKVVDELEGEDAVKAIFRRFFGYNPESVKIDGKTVEITYKPGKGNKAALLSRLLEEFEEVRLNEVYTRAKSGADNDQ